MAAWLAERHGLETVHPQRGWEALRKIGWSIQTARPCNPKAATPEEQEAFKRKLEGTVVETRSAHPDLPVEVWAIDEHRLGLKPVRRRVWAPAGQRPIALGHHRYKWLHVTAFVQPTSGETAWYLSNAINKPLFEKLLEDFARQTGAGQQRIIVLVLDNAGWHGPANLTVPDGIRLVFLPPYTPELQPAERLWSLVDEPVANRYFETLDDLSETLAKRCCTLQDDPETISGHTDFPWWPATMGRN